MYQAPHTPQLISGVLDCGFRLYKASLGETAVLAGAASLLSSLYTRWIEIVAATSDPGVGAALSLIGFLVVVAPSLVLMAAIVARVDAVAKGRRLALRESLMIGWRRLPAVLGALLCYAVSVAVGLVLFIIPGMILSVSFVFGAYAAVTDEMGTFEALSYSRRLVRGHWWRTAALVSVIGIIVGSLYSMVLVFAVGAMLMNPDVLNGVSVTMPWYVQFVLMPAMGALIMPLLYTMFIATLNDLKLRHGGEDIAARIAATAT